MAAVIIKYTIPDLIDSKMINNWLKKNLFKIGINADQNVLDFMALEICCRLCKKRYQEYCFCLDGYNTDENRSLCVNSKKIHVDNDFRQQLYGK